MARVGLRPPGPPLGSACPRPHQRFSWFYPVPARVPMRSCAFLEADPSLKSRAALTTAYAAGLRASEVASLKITNTDTKQACGGADDMVGDLRITRRGLQIGVTKQRLDDADVGAVLQQDGWQSCGAGCGR